MLDHQASDEVTDAIAHIEMQRQAAAHEPNPNPVAAGQRALQQLQALYDQESKMPRSEERTASLHAANLEAIQGAIIKLKSRLRPGSFPGGGGGGGGGGPRHQQRPVRTNANKGGQPRGQGGKPQQGGQSQHGGQGGPRQHQGGQPQHGGQGGQGGQRQPQGGQPVPQSGQPAQQGGANAQGGQPAPRGPNAPSKKRRGRRSGHRNPNASRPENA